MKLKLLLKILSCLCIVIALASCKKVTDIEPPVQPQNRILSYQITNVQGDPVKGVVNDDEKSIKVYLPYHNYLTSLQPDIKLSEGATVTPASGTMIENLLDVFDNGRDISYTVTGKDGSKATYKLQIIVQQGAFTLGEISPSSTDLTELSFDTKFLNAYLQIPCSGEIPSGNGLLDLQLIKITLIDESNKEYVIDNTRGAKLSTSTTYLTFLMDNISMPNFTSGIYKVKVRFYSRIVTLKNPVKITRIP